MPQRLNSRALKAGAAQTTGPAAAQLESTALNGYVGYQLRRAQTRVFSHFMQELQD